MTQARYYRLALLFPVALPAFGWLLLALLPGGSSPGAAYPEVIQVIGNGLLLVTFGSIFYGVPYVLIAAVLWARSKDWTAAQFRRWLLILPAVFTVGTGTVVALGNLPVAQHPDWLDYVLQYSRSAFGVGFGEAALIWLGELAGVRLHLLKLEPLAA